MGVNLSTSIGKVQLKNPVLVASGTFGHAKEFERFMDLRRLGAIVTKTITVKPRLGNPPQRIVETPSGMLNAIGLQNPGVEGFITDKLPYLRKIGVPLFVSVMGYSTAEIAEVVGRLESEGGIDGYELNLSCPNVSYAAKVGSVSHARMFAHDPELVRQAVSACRAVTSRTLIAKLGPDVSDIGLIAEAAESAGADAIALINTFVAMVVDVERRVPVLANKTGGLSGPCVRPIAVRLTWEAKKRVRIPVIGIGGIRNAKDALEFLIVGACAVQVGTANFMNPAAPIEVLEGLEKHLKQRKIPALTDVIGSLKDRA
ncbi:MAG: Dihydroorotate dehydrogenase B (NAD(+)), catalytic subunit [Candidatus Omnitrophica bacterium]|nr:Dihydroorotate dehydrogenase B (NAD(+)), catalytic subunit [Candidatus Omnitrophota bacterium]